ncbi:MAG: WD40 repeat domain-containing protein [Planctomycetota bacterium]
MRCHKGPTFAERCSPEVLQALRRSGGGRGQVDRDDLLFGLLQLEDARATRVMRAMGIDRAGMAATLGGPRLPAPGQGVLTPQLALAIDFAAAEASLEGREEIDTAHLLVGLARGTRAGHDLHREPLLAAGRLAIGARDGKVSVWDLVRGRGPRTRDAGRPVFSVAADREWRHVAAGCGDGRLDVWDLAHDLHVRFPRGHKGPVRAVAWSPTEPRLLTGSDDATAAVWDAESGDRTLELKGHDGPVRTVTFDASGAYLYTGCDDGTVRRWESERGALCETLEGHAAAVVRVAFLDPRLPLVSRSEDDKAILWAKPRQHHDVVPDELAPVFARFALTAAGIRRHLGVA